MLQTQRLVDSNIHLAKSASFNLWVGMTYCKCEYVWCWRSVLIIIIIFGHDIKVCHLFHSSPGAGKTDTIVSITSAIYLSQVGIGCELLPSNIRFVFSCLSLYFFTKVSYYVLKNTKLWSLQFSSQWRLLRPSKVICTFRCKSNRMLTRYPTDSFSWSSFNFWNGDNQVAQF